MKHITVCSIIIGLSLSSLACDKGLVPPDRSSLSGKVRFTGVWPTEDSVKTLAVVLIPGKPPYHVPDLIQGVISNTIKFSQLRYKSSDTTFSFDLQPGEYGYLGVAQHYSDSIYMDWRSVGFAHDSRDSAQTFVLKLGDQITNANIVVNFDSLPWQPFIP